MLLAQLKLEFDHLDLRIDPREHSTGGQQKRSVSANVVTPTCEDFSCKEHER